jgi:hypothetical protein
MCGFPAESEKAASFPPDPRAERLPDRKQDFVNVHPGFLGHRKYPSLDP